MPNPDPIVAQIAAQFQHHGVEKSGSAYLILDQRTSNPVARLRPIKDTDRFELFYWSNVKGGVENLRQHGAHERVPRAP